MEKEVKVVNESISNSGIKKDYKDAILEYIWNGFDANANEIRIDYSKNDLDGIEEIYIKDNGDGINYETLDNTFGAFLSSEKKNKNVFDSIHGSQGKGRFSFSTFSNNCKWETVYKNGKKYKYSIIIQNGKKNKYDVSDKSETKEKTGTLVKISDIYSLKNDSMDDSELKQRILNNFAWYLFLKKASNSKIFLNNNEIDYQEIINEELSEENEIEISNMKFKIFFINWKSSVNSKYYFYMLDDSMQQKNKITTKFNNNGIDFYHSVYVISEYFNDFERLDFEENEQISINPENIKCEKDSVYKDLLKKLNEIIAKKYKEFIGKKSKILIDNFKKDGIFPKLSDDKYGRLRQKDLENVVKEVYCVQPKIFKGASKEQKQVIVQFLDLLLNSEERENILCILENVVNLTKEERENLVRVLDKTKLNHIISVMKMLEDRMLIVESLKKIIYEMAKYTNERDHIQKIMEENYWLFGEEYALVTADKTFQKALEEYEYKLYGYKNKSEYEIQDIQKNRRMDIFLAAKRNLSSYENSVKLQENIILELKAPDITIDGDIFRQIEDYMLLIKKEPQFNSIKRKWSFYAVSSKVDDYIKTKYEEYENTGEPFLVKKVNDYKIYIMTWDDVFRNFEENYSFLYDKLRIDKGKIEDELIEVENSREGVNNIVDNILDMKAM